METQKKITDITDKVRDMLIEKNEDYGNSALEPINIFSDGNAEDSLCARIDDKLARIKNVGLNDDTEDTLFDLCGYLVLLIIAKDDAIPFDSGEFKTFGNSQWTKSTT